MAQPFGEFRMPARPGDVVDHLGRPVTPTGVDPARLAAVQQAAIKQGSLPPEARPATLPPPIDISSLSPEKQNELRVMLGMTSPIDYLKNLSAGPSPATQPTAADPSAQVPPWGWGAQAPPAPLPQPPAPPIPPPAPAPIPAAPQGFLSAGGNLTPTHCSHCGFDLSITDDTVITDEDKVAYDESWLGGNRFRKKYQLFDDRVSIVFRSLTTTEEAEVLQQVIADAYRDAQRQTPLPAAVQGLSLIGYRMCLGLESIAGVATPGISGSALPALAEWKKAISSAQWKVTDGDTPVQAVRRWLCESVLIQDHVFQTVLRLFTSFDDLSRKLRDRTRDPNS